MAYTVQSLMNGLMSNPDVLAVGVAVGFLIKTFMSRRRRRSGGLGGGGGFM